MAWIELHQKAMSEDELLGAVIDALHAYGWLVHHCRPAMTKGGRYTTAIQGDAGAPDIVAVRGGQVLFAELKREDGQLTPAQQRWQDELSHVPHHRPGEAIGVAWVRTVVWRPRDWLSGRILEALR